MLTGISVTMERHPKPVTAWRLGVARPTRPRHSTPGYAPLHQLLPRPPSTVATSRPIMPATANHLPPGLEMRRDPLGREFYVDHIMKTTSWKIPNTENVARWHKARAQTRILLIPYSEWRQKYVEDHPRQMQSSVSAQF